MKVLGIIAEYNPLHSGHAYMLDECRKLSGADYCIVIMSGDFVQRGEPAIADKYVRTRMALSAGADLVLELPAISSCAAAGDFAEAGVSLLAHTGVVTDFAFGSESGDLCALLKIADILADEPAAFKQTLSKHLKSGLSFPAARHLALSAFVDHTDADCLTGSNNILGIEYLLALKKNGYNLRPLTIKRQGSDYNDPSMTHTFCSATALRHQTLMHWPDVRIDAETMPSGALEIYKKHLSVYAPVCMEDFAQIIHYALYCRESFDDIYDISYDLSRRIASKKNTFFTVESFVADLKAKNYTQTKINRALIHLILSQTKEDAACMKALGQAPYLRILGFKKSAAALLSSLKQNTDIPVITKPASVSKLLNNDQMSVFSKDVDAVRVYRMVLVQKSGRNQPDEYCQSPVIL